MKPQTDRPDAQSSEVSVKEKLLLWGPLEESDEPGDSDDPEQTVRTGEQGNKSA